MFEQVQVQQIPLFSHMAFNPMKSNNNDDASSPPMNSSSSPIINKSEQMSTQIDSSFVDTTPQLVNQQHNNMFANSRPRIMPTTNQLLQHTPLLPQQQIYNQFPNMGMMDNSRQNYGYLQAHLQQHFQQQAQRLHLQQQLLQQLSQIHGLTSMINQTRELNNGLLNNAIFNTTPVASPPLDTKPILANHVNNNVEGLTRDTSSVKDANAAPRTCTRTSQPKQLNSEAEAEVPTPVIATRQPAKRSIEDVAHTRPVKRSKSKRTKYLCKRQGCSKIAKGGGLCIGHGGGKRCVKPDCDKVARYAGSLCHIHHKREMERRKREEDEEFGM